MPQASGSTRAAVAFLSLLFSLPIRLSAQNSNSEETQPSKDVAFEQLESVYRFQNDGTGEIVQSGRIRVLTETGRAAVGQLYFYYSSQLHDLRIDYFRTVKPDGTQIAADPEKAFDIAAPITQGAPTFSDLKMKGMVAAKLEVGDQLEYQTTMKIRSPLKAGDFWAIHFPNRQVLVNSEVVVLDVPAGRKLTFKSNPDFHYGEEEKVGRRIYRWQLANPTPRESDEETAKPLFAVSTLSDWKELGEWYLALQQGRTQPTPEIQALVTKLIADKKTSREKVEAIYTYVAESIRYVSISFGIGAVQAHAAPDIFRNGYGDCKDKHGLLTAMLKAGGFEAYPVLVNSTQGVFEPAVPAPAQFDHVMSVVPLDGQQLWLDTTLEVAPPGFLITQVRGKQALLAEPGAIRLVGVPEQPPFPEVVRSVSTGKLGPSGSLTLETRVEARGAYEVIYRKLFRLSNKDAISSFVKTLGQAQFGTSAEEPKSSDPLDLTRAFSFQYRGTKSDFFGVLENSVETEIPHLFFQREAWGSSLRKAREEPPKGGGSQEKAQVKAKDLALGSPGKFEEAIALELDPVYEVDLPLPIHVERSFGTYDSAYAFEQGHVKIARAVNIKFDKLPAGRWKELESFQKLVDRDLDQKLVLRRMGKVDVLAQADSMAADELNEAGRKALDEKRDHKLARTLLEKATTKDPKHKSAWNNLGRAYFALDMLEEAEQAYKKQIEVDPSDEYAYNNLGLLYHRQGRYDGAISAYKSQIEINPFDRYVYPNLAETYKKMGKWEEAAQAYEKARAVLHDSPYLLIRTGDMFLKAGKPEEARRRFDRALEMDTSESPSTLNEIAYSLAEARLDLDKAQGYAESAVEKTTAALQLLTLSQTPPLYSSALSSLGSFLDTLGWVLYQKGKLDDAELCLRSAFELHEDVVVADHLGRLYAAKHEAPNALRYYAYATIESVRPEPVSQELESYVREKFGDPKELKNQFDQLEADFRAERRVRVPGRPLAWPANAPGKSGVPVMVRVLVQENGVVSDAEVISGEEPFRSTALQDARQVRFHPLCWPNHALKTVRTLEFYYLLDKSVMASWSFGSDRSQSRGLVSGQKQADTVPVAVAQSGATKSQEPLAPDPEEAAARRAREADGHFTSGAQLEAKALAESSAKNAQGAREDLLAAFEQYRIAHQLAPKNPNYKSAYERLSRKLKQP